MCAVKELSLSSEPDELEDSIREIRLLETLPAHPNIVQYFFHTVDGDVLRLFMKRYSGTLSTFIAKHHRKKIRFPPHVIRSFLIDIATGLKFLHKQNIIHRGMLLIC